MNFYQFLESFDVAVLSIFDFGMFFEIIQSLKSYWKACEIVYVWEMKQHWTGGCI